MLVRLGVVIVIMLMIVQVFGSVPVASVRLVRVIVAVIVAVFGMGWGVRGVTVEIVVLRVEIDVVHLFGLLLMNRYAAQVR